MRPLPDRLLVDSVTIRRPVQTAVAGSKRPVFERLVVVQGVRARFNPAGTSMSRNVLGQTPKRSMRLFVNPPVDLRENDEVVRESNGEVFVVTEVKDFFGGHQEAVLEERK
jgi:hypothetical protein